MEDTLGGIEFVGGPLDGQVRWGNIAAEVIRYPASDGTDVIYKSSGAIKAGTGDCEFRFAGTEPQQPDKWTMGSGLSPR
jgi:hypothetical protein